jgi:hypothetical protein
MAVFLYDEFGIPVTASSISRALASIGWSKKATRHVAKERNADLVVRWGPRRDELHEGTSAALQRLSLSSHFHSREYIDRRSPSVGNDKHCFSRSSLTISSRLERALEQTAY